MHHLSVDMKACVEACLRCYSVCLGSAMNHCLESGASTPSPTTSGSCWPAPRCAARRRISCSSTRITTSTRAKNARRFARRVPRTASVSGICRTALMNAAGARRAVKRWLLEQKEYPL